MGWGRRGARSRRVRSGIGLVGALGISVAGCAIVPTSVTTEGQWASGGLGGSGSPALSDDGLTVAFSSDHTDLASGDSNGQALDVFVRVHARFGAKLLPAGTTELISQSTDGTGGNSHSVEPDISGGGRYVAFSSVASNLVPGDTNNASDVFVRDRVAQTTERASVASNGDEADGGSAAPSISSDGRYVAFTSSASNLAPEAPVVAGVFVHDRLTGETRLVSANASGEQANDWSTGPQISADGSTIAYRSTATNLSPLDVDPDLDVYVGPTAGFGAELVSVGAVRVDPDLRPSIDGDGSRVVFQADEVAGVGTGGFGPDVWVRDLAAQTTVLVSASSDGTPSDGFSDNFPSITDDGDLVSFSSEGENLVPDDHNDHSDVFVKDLTTQETTRVSVGELGIESALGSVGGSLSGTGSHIAFMSGSTFFPWDDFAGFYVYELFLRAL